MPAFINPVSRTLPGFGSPAYNGSVLGTAITTATTTTVTITATTTTPSGGTPFNTDGSAGPRAGKWRVRTSSPGATAILAFTVTVTDGTNVWQIATIPGSTAGNAIDMIGTFNVDEPQSSTLLGLTGISFILVSTGAAPGVTVDVEVSMTN